ncbi:MULTISPECIES: DUF6160 family protein [unclassified Acinetobacter]|uniref:DUF6160 family protein n=1 Tax=unclassified Acinetobacter TaxID=196816 RepID=UPI0018AB8B44|nr:MULTISPECIES: DUF6160 family protein [unclassified Acinetobacter]MBJ9953241.1 FilA [Acinetobacter baumannii]
MKKNNKLGCISLLILSPVAMAMQPLDDQGLSQTTGQAGIDVGINISKVQINQLSVIDRDGLGTSVNDANKASLVVAGKTAATLADQSLNVTFLGASTTPTMKVMLDADGGTAGKPFANIGLSFGSNITGIKVSPFALYLAGASSSSGPAGYQSIFTGTSEKSDVIKILKMDNGFDINFAAIKPTMNLQLGNAPQGRMLAFGGAIQSICGAGTGCAIALLSDDSDIGANFNFQLTGTDKTNGFSLNGFYAGVESSGFVFGNTGESSKFDVGINQMIMGNSGTSTSTVFNGLQNGSMGNFGAIGTSVTDLKVKINGL